MAAPLRSRIASYRGVREHPPWPMITTRSQSAATSCMTCEENKTQRPCAFKVQQHLAQIADRHHVEPVGRLVEHDIAGVVHQRARQRHLDALALRESLGAAFDEAFHAERSGRARRCATPEASPAMPCSVPK